MSAVAAVDLGTISTRLLIRADDGQLIRAAAVTGPPGETPSRDHVAATLARYRQMMDEAGVEQVRAVATAGLRMADDPEPVLAAAAAKLGVRPEVIDGAEEARLSFRGACAGRDRALGPYAVVDLGGASTEFALGADPDADPEAVLSVAMGASTFTARYVETDPPRPEELLACLSVADAHLDDVVREIPGVLNTPTWVGLAGTITTVAAVEIGLVDYTPDAVDGFVLDRDAAEDVYRTLVTERRADRLHNPGLPADRVDTIVGGCTLLVAIMRTLGIDQMIVSEADLLDGIVATLAS